MGMGRSSDAVLIKGLKRLVDETSTDEMNGGLCGKFSDVPEIIFTWAGQVGIDGGWA
jgi:hypothetical protein